MWIRTVNGLAWIKHKRTKQGFWIPYNSYKKKPHTK